NNQTDSTAQPVAPWKTYRGFNISPTTDNEILEELINKTGANLIRLSFSTMPMVHKTPPYDFNEEAFRELDRILDWCQSRDVRVLIDPHTTPGTRSNFTIFPDDEFWTNPTWYNHLIKLWVRIANDYKNEGDVIAGYDLLNEPAVPDTSIHGDQWNHLVKILVDTIRSTGDLHTIVVESTGRMDGNRYINRIDGIRDLKLPTDDNIVASTNFYEPFSFTHQGVDVSAPIGVTYPGQNEGEYWDENRLLASMQPIRDFQKAHPNIPIFIGELSCSRASGPAGDNYLRDLLNGFEKEGWSWAYHEFRGYSGWDAEMPYTEPATNESVPRSYEASRFALLADFYARNNFSANELMTTEVYRLTHTTQGYQLLTSSESEAGYASSLFGYENDGVVFKAASAINRQLKPVYRLRHPVSNDRLFTVDKHERDSALANLGYENEGNAFFVPLSAEGDY